MNEMGKREWIKMIEANIKKEPIKVYWAKLQRLSNYRSECPFCARGLFLVKRSQETFELLDEDTCTYCATRIKYMDFDLLLQKDGVK